MYNYIIIRIILWITFLLSAFASHGQYLIKDYCAAIALSKPAILFKSDHTYGMELSLKGIYIEDNTIFYHLRLENHSNVRYDVEYLRFYIRDKEKVSRTASQELDQKPLYVHGNAKYLKGNSAVDLVYALDKFTIPDAKLLIIELYEHNGGRHLQLKVSNRLIVNAKTLQ